MAPLLALIEGHGRDTVLAVVYEALTRAMIDGDRAGRISTWKYFHPAVASETHRAAMQGLDLRPGDAFGAWREAPPQAKAEPVARAKSRPAEKPSVTEVELLAPHDTELAARLRRVDPYGVLHPRLFTVEGMGELRYVYPFGDDDDLLNAIRFLSARAQENEERRGWIASWQDVMEVLEDGSQPWLSNGYAETDVEEPDDAASEAECDRPNHWWEDPKEVRKMRKGGGWLDLIRKHTARGQPWPVMELGPGPWHPACVVSPGLVRKLGLRDAFGAREEWRGAKVSIEVRRDRKRHGLAY